MELNHLSYSSLSAYQLCPKSWEWKYSKGIKAPPSPSLVLGSAFHSTIEAQLRAQVAGEQFEPAQGWNTAWLQALEKGEINWGEESPEQTYNQGLRLVAHPDSQKLIQSISPAYGEDGKLCVEKYIELRVPGVPIPIIGYIDVIETSGVLADFKTSARSWNADKAKGELQPLFYLAALSQAGYKANPLYQFRHYVWLKLKTPQVQTFTTQHDLGRLFWILQTIREVWQGISAGVFPPNNSTWKCSPKWCDYYNICRGS